MLQFHNYIHKGVLRLRSLASEILEPDLVKTSVGIVCLQDNTIL